MGKSAKWLLVATLVLGGSAATQTAFAQVTDSSGANVQEGDNRATSNQRGSSGSGDAVAGQVAGSVSGGDTSIDATNRSTGVSVDTGTASGSNTAAQFVGLNDSGDTGIGVVGPDEISNVDATNLQSGDNRYINNQAANASSGDGVGGQVIGAVTSPGGSADIVAANRSEDSDITTGSADAANNSDAFVGLNASDELEVGATDDITGPCPSCVNVQDGDNRLSGRQSANASSGDGVGGQVLGVVSAGDASVDAANLTRDTSVDTGSADAANDASNFVGLNTSAETDIGSAELIDVNGVNLQDGDNRKTFGQSANASSGDAVGGQVAGVVTSAGGSADLVLANRSEDSDANTGSSDFFNNDAGFVGLNFSDDELEIGFESDD